MSAPICPTLDDFLSARATTLPTLELLQLEIPADDADPIAKHLRERQALLRMMADRARGPMSPAPQRRPTANPKGSNDG